MSKYSNLKNYIKGKKSLREYFSDHAGVYIGGALIIGLVMISKGCEHHDKFEKNYDAPAQNISQKSFLANNLKSIDDKFK